MKVKTDVIKAISRHFGIQSANPVHIMTQESTKEFLNAKNQKHKYNLFMEGTTLKQTMDNYDESARFLNECDEKNDAKKAEIAATKKMLKDLGETVKVYENLLEHGNSIEQRKKKLTWIPVEQAEKELAEATKEKEKYAVKFESHKEEEKKYQREIEEARKEQQNDELADLKVKMEQCRTDAKPTKEKEARLARQREEYRDQINDIERDINEKKRDIDELQKIRMKNANPQMKQKLEEKRAQIANIQQQLAEARATEEQREQDREVLSEQLDRAKRDRMQVQDQESKLGYSIDKRAHELRQIKQQEQTKTNPFGPKVTQIQVF